MLKQAQIDKLKSFGLNVDELVTAIKAPGEVDVQIPDLNILTPDQLTERDNNTREEGRKLGFSDGKTAGIEIASKTIAKNFQLDPSVVDFKNPEKVHEALKSSYAKGDTGLQEQIRLLQTDKENLLKEKETILQTQKQLQFDNDIIGCFPSNRSNILSDKEYLLAIKTNLEFTTDEGKQIVKRNGEVMRDPVTKNPIDHKKAIESLFQERKWVGNNGSSQGRGASDGLPSSNSNGFKKLSDVEAAWKKEHPDGNIMSAEFQAYTQSVTKDIKDFDYYN